MRIIAKGNMVTGLYGLSTMHDIYPLMWILLDCRGRYICNDRTWTGTENPPDCNNYRDLGRLLSTPTWYPEWNTIVLPHAVDHSVNAFLIGIAERQIPQQLQVFPPPL